MKFDNNLDGSIGAIAEYDGKLFFAGNFTDTNGIQTTNIIAWDGKEWKAVGEGLNGKVMTLAGVS